MKICFLVGDYVPYQVLLIKELTERNDVTILAFHVGRFVTETPKNLRNFSTQQYDSLSKNEILEKITMFTPDIMVTAGWMIPEYNWICRNLKKSTKTPIVAMSDTPWYNTLKQNINALISPFHVRKSFTHLWVAGIYQYDYARKLGFKNDEIIFNCLSADLNLFKSIDIQQKAASYPKNFLYIGRYTEVKGLVNLMEAWDAIEDKKGWTFTLVGSGNMKDQLIESGNFIVKDYMSQQLLLSEMQNSGCFVLPSLKEPWALVIHEAAAAGLPIICTKTCGAAPHFVIDNFNGFKVENDSVHDLKKAMQTIIEKTSQELTNFSCNSRKLSTSITPEKSIGQLLQIV